MDHGKIVARTLLHSAYIPELGNGDDAVVVSEIVEYEDGTTQPNLRKFKSPTVSFWVTKEQYRNHTDKKELERLERLDEFRTKYKDKDRVGSSFERADGNAG